jgi:NAD(P)-dependent dehydrogenase (short-subunit alcohol dehydrogenase family)
VIFDVTDREACDQVMGDVRLDALVNNAGFQSTGAIADVPDAGVDGATRREWHG